MSAKDDDLAQVTMQAAQQDPAQFEQQYVHQVYDIIAPHFSHTRHSPWPKVAEFLMSLEPGSLVADVGCGNGKYLNVNPSLFMFASDRSAPLASLAVERVGGGGIEMCVADNLALPYRDGSMDAVISIAVLHHLASPERRLAGLRELIRVLRPRGKALVYVWAIEQEGRRGRFSSQDQLIPWHLSNKFRGGTAQPGQEQGVEVPEKHAVEYKRFYHLFAQGELEELARTAGGCRVAASYYDHENWCAVVERDD